MTDKEILIEAFQRIGVDFQFDDDGHIGINESEKNQIWFIFDSNDSFSHKEIE